jgi:hypothetical protein
MSYIEIKDYLYRDTDISERFFLFEPFVVSFLILVIIHSSIYLFKRKSK